MNKHSLLIATIFAGLSTLSANASAIPQNIDNDAQRATALPLDVEVQELTSRSADFTALRLNPDGVPVARVDMFFGDKLPKDEAALLALLDPFTFGMGAELERKEEGSRWSSVLVPTTRPTQARADLVHFDAQANFALEFRRIEDPSTLSCSTAWFVRFDGSGSTGSSFYWYAYADAITATTGPQRNSNCDPDAYLTYWNGSAYTAFSSSTSSTTLDAVGAHYSACTSNYWRVQIHMFYGGTFGVRGMTFNAN